MKHHSEVFKGHHDHCLNCGHAIHGNFCSQCGQNTHTHRLSIGHFIIHDLVHSFWHVDHGILFTIEEVLIRPGTAAMDYIRGKRMGRFPILTLILILIGVNFWLFHNVEMHTFDSDVKLAIERNPDDSLKKLEFYKEQLLLFFEHYKKWLILTLLPLGSFSSFLVFRRAKLNYTEHLLLNSYAFAGALVVVTYMLLFSLCLPDSGDLFFELGMWLVIGIYLLTHLQAFKSYKIVGLLWRFLLSASLTFFLAVFTMLAILGIWAAQVSESGALPH
jgi:hypothetical protein